MKKFQSSYIFGGLCANTTEIQGEPWQTLPFRTPPLISRNVVMPGPVL